MKKLINPYKHASTQTTEDTNNKPIKFKYQQVDKGSKVEEIQEPPHGKGCNTKVSHQQVRAPHNIWYEPNYVILLIKQLK